MNAGLDDLRRHGAEGRLDAERQQLAAEYRRLEPAAKRQRLDEFRVHRRELAEAVGSQAAAAGDLALSNKSHTSFAAT